MVRKPCCVCAITCQISTKSAQPFRRHCEITVKVANTDCSNTEKGASLVSWQINRFVTLQISDNFELNLSNYSDDMQKLNISNGYPLLKILKLPSSTSWRRHRAFDIMQIAETFDLFAAAKFELDRTCPSWVTAASTVTTAHQSSLMQAA